MKMLKTMNKEKRTTKRKENKELRKGTKNELPNNLIEIYLFHVYRSVLLFYKMIKKLQRNIYIYVLNTRVVQCVKNRRNLNSQALNASFFTCTDMAQTCPRQHLR